MKILPDYEHMEYRDVYTCRTYLTPLLWLLLLLLQLHGRSWVAGGVGGLTCFPPWELLFPGFLPFLCAAVLGRTEW